MKKRKVIEFANTEKGKIALEIEKNSLILSKILNDDIKVRERFEKGEIKTEELVELKFYKTESIDAVIEFLIAIKCKIIETSAC